MKAAVLLVALAGCTDSPLADYHARWWVTERDDRLLLSAMLYDADPNAPAKIDFDLEADVTLPDDHWTLTHAADGAFVGWRTLPQPLAADASVVLTLRGAGAPVDVVATAPEPFQLDDVPVFAPRSTPLMVTWGPPGTDPQLVDFVSPCAQAELELPADAASATFRGDMLQVSDPVRTCTAQLIVRRVRETPAGSPFAGGTIRFERWVTTSFASTP